MEDNKISKDSKTKLRTIPQQSKTSTQRIKSISQTKTSKQRIKSPNDKSQQKGFSLKKQLSKSHKSKSGPCPWLCNLVPIDVPPPNAAQSVLHPRKDVFILKVAKVSANGDRRCKMELELVTPKGPEKQAPCRTDTREAQCDPEPPPCTCCNRSRRKKK